MNTTKIKISIIILAVFWLPSLLFAQSKSVIKTISSINELVKMAAKSNNQIFMKPGVYQMEDYLDANAISGISADAINRMSMITFSGSNNTFDLSGVTIEVNTKLLALFRKYVIEVSVMGNRNHIKGLTLTDIGNNPTFKGGNSFTVGGEDNKIEAVTLNVQGSYPYGYGDLLGKGSSKVVGQLKKHSGMMVEGTRDSIISCSIFSKSFGHCFYVQGGRDVYFKDCYAEAVIRTTDEMLAEKSGPAFDINFVSVYKNYNGQKVITPGYTKSLSECGFRMYGQGGLQARATGAVTAINCKAKNTRIGFAFMKLKENVLIKDCEAVSCEAGYNLTGVKVENSRGDASIGPLLYLDGDDAEVELYLMPGVGKTTVHSIACIAGNNNTVTLKNWKDTTREKALEIKIGSTTPSGTNSFSPTGTAITAGLKLNNFTGMPIEIGKTASSCVIKSNSTVVDNGMKNQITKIK